MRNTQGMLNNKTDSISKSENRKENSMMTIFIKDTKGDFILALRNAREKRIKEVQDIDQLILKFEQASNALTLDDNESNLVMDYATELTDPMGISLMPKKATKKEWNNLTTFIFKRMNDDGIIKNGKLTTKGKKELKHGSG